MLVPNEKGYEAARAAGAKVIAVFASASEGFSRANINCSVAESIERFKPVVARAKADGIKVRGYISCVLGCPFDGEVKPQAVVDVARTLWDLGCYEVSLGDTIGVGTPLKARHLLRAVAGSVPMAIWRCIFTTPTARRWPISMPGWRRAARVIDSAAGGLGGCPYAPGATGNVATEDVVYMLEGMGIATGVDMAKLVAATNDDQPADRAAAGQPRGGGVECEGAGALDRPMRKRGRAASNPHTRALRRRQKALHKKIFRQLVTNALAGPS